jgi:hypothetical protein
MSKLKGHKEFEAWQAKKPLTRKQAILAQCYDCNGESSEDCKGERNCPLYAYFPYKGGKRRQNSQSKLLEAENEGFVQPQLSGKDPAESKND